MNTLKNILLKLRFALLAVILLTAYGCGGSSTTPAAGSSSLTGTAATGAPIANATVHIKGANGVMVETTTDANGNYTSPNLATLTAPYLVHVIKPAGLNPAVELYSIGSAAGVVNVHPLTDLIIRTWYEVQGTDVATAFNAVVPATPPTATELGVIKQVVKNLVAQFLGLIGNLDSTSFDLISTPFTANSTGFDNFLDNIQVNAASGVIGINTSGVSGAGTLAEYHATLAVSGVNMTSTLAEDLNNDSTFTTVSTATNPISGITTSPYAGVWSLNFTQTVLGSPSVCGGAVGATGTLPFVVDGSGNFILLETDGSGRVMISGNIAANGSLTATVYGDTLNPNGGTCPAGTLTATMTSTSAGTGTFLQGGDEGDLVFARINSFAGTWTLRYTITAATDEVACGEAIASIGIPQGGTDTIVNAQGSFTNVTENITGTITSGGIVSFTIPGSSVTTDCDYGGTVGTGTGNYANAYGTFKHNNNKVSGTWSLTRQ